MSFALRTDPLHAAILSGPINHDPIQDSRRTFRRGLMGAQVCISIGANGSYIPIVWRLGPPLAIADFTSWVALDFWAIQANMQNAFGPGTAKEIELIQRNSIGKVGEIAVSVSAIFIAVAGRSPAALPALDYDQSAGIPAATILYLQAFLSQRSTELSIQKMIRSKNQARDEFGKKIEAAREEMISLVSAYQECFRAQNGVEKMETMTILDQIRSEEGGDKVMEFISEILLKPQPVVADRGTCMKLTEAFVEHSSTALGVLFAATMQTAGSIYTFSKSKDLTDSDFLAVVLTGLTIGSGLYLSSTSVVSTTKRAVKDLFSSLVCRRQKSIAEQLDPHLTTALKCLGLTLNLGTYGSTIVVWGDFYEGTSEKEIFVYGGGTAYFLLAATATLDLVEEVVEEIILQRNSTYEKKVIQLHRDLGKLKSLLQCSLYDFAIFLKNCPEAIKTRLLTKANLAESALSDYLQEPLELEI